MTYPAGLFASPLSVASMPPIRPAPFDANAAGDSPRHGCASEFDRVGRVGRKAIDRRLSRRGCLGGGNVGHPLPPRAAPAPTSDLGGCAWVGAQRNHGQACQDRPPDPSHAADDPIRQGAKLDRGHREQTAFDFVCQVAPCCRIWNRHIEYQRAVPFF